LPLKDVLLKYMNHKCGLLGPAAFTQQFFKLMHAGVRVRASPLFKAA
jgi:hypothetical protein